MHYRNGREAKPGDRVVDLNGGSAGILYAAHGQSDTCNGRLAHPTGGDPYVNLKDCLHADDVAAAFPKPPS